MLYGLGRLTVVNFEKLGISDPTKQRIYLQGIKGGAGLTDTFEQAVLNHMFADPPWTNAGPWYIGLSSTTPTEAGTNLTEPSTGSYARVSTSAGDWAAASGTAPATKTNTATFTFPTATADWASAANLTHFTLHDHITNTAAANFIAWGALTVAKPVLNGDTASFAASAITFQLGDPGDTY